MNSANQEKVIRVMNAVAAGTDDQNSSVVDTQGYQGVKFYTAFGTITAGAVTSVKLQQGAQPNGSDMADLEGTAISVADDDDNQVVVHDIYRPQKRYVRAVVDRGTQNAAIDGIIAVLYGPMAMPTSDDSGTVVGRETYASPDEGTA